MSTNQVELQLQDAMPEIAHSSNKRAGWSEDEDMLLWQHARTAREQGIPIKSVFDAVARMTNRKPNSVRNYYYAQLRQGAAGDLKDMACAAFVPFQDDEIKGLLREVLGAQAKGESVRACTLRLGSGDNKLMLRYQNKYRNVLKSNPALVYAVIDEMRADGTPYVNPYMYKERKRHTSRKQNDNLVDIISDIVQMTQQVDGLNLHAFFEGIRALSRAAVMENGMTSDQTAQNQRLQREMLQYEQEHKSLRAQHEELEQRFIIQKERTATLLTLFQQLMRINRNFLGLNSVIKVSSLSNYINELSANMEACEKLLPMESKAL